MLCIYSKGFPHSSVGKESACNAGDLGSIPGSGRFPGEGNGNPLQYSCLENPRDRGTWWVTVHGVAKSQTRPSDFTFTFTLVAMLSSQLCLTLKPQGLQPARLLCPWSFPGKNTKVGCHFLLQEGIVYASQLIVYSSPNLLG